ncbi:RsiW-degrading membrane proteinase PrsW (M82 family) [Streptosporangium album]|uniref:RsiW-degrading membrane proteinase PrsW (M82 family) n=1 Tax=Streptosporangium album TaxID=47479 RepID=A0A7W7RU97_9ACTN|nr:PrsW family glutamic-type intramembrane protease [Streptosporangium album]MBB4938331.1 RsiW-degrading membrane proteinase PrsW (M82 family) [Streptosporangium album]
MREHFRFYRHRWFKVWIAMAALSAALIAMTEAVGNRAVMPAAFFYGAAAGPVGLLVAIHDRTGIGASVPGVTLVGMFLFGGGVALLLGGYFDALFIPDKHGPSILQVGWIEESAKALPLLLVALTGRHLTKAAGVALGLSCATGFAIMESMSYAWKNVDHAGAVNAGMVLFMRGLATPFSHLAWTGLICAVAFGAWQARGRIVITFSVAGAFVAAAVLHSLNDGLLTLDIPGPVRLLFLVVAAVSYWLFYRATRDLVPGAAAGPAAVPGLASRPYAS